MSLNGRQPSVSGTWAQTERPSSCWREKTRRSGGCSRSEASLTEHKDVLIRPSAGLIQTTTTSREVPFLRCKIWGWGCSGVGSARQPPSPQRVLHPNANFQLCSSCACTEILFFVVNICDVLITVVEVICQSQSTGTSVSLGDSVGHPALVVAHFLLIKENMWDVRLDSKQKHAAGGGLSVSFGLYIPNIKIKWRPPFKKKKKASSVQLTRSRQLQMCLHNCYTDTDETTQLHDITVRFQPCVT